MESDANPTVLLVHEGELADLRGVLAQLGVDYAETDGSDLAAAAATQCELLIGAPQFFMDLGAQKSTDGRKLIAVADGGSRTLQATMRRAGVALVIRRPVHPAALRLLLLHSLYRGPEKRRARRIEVGAPVRFRSGFRRLSGVLLEASLDGCRLLCDRQLSRGAKVVVSIEPPTGGGRLKVRGEVLRSHPAPEHIPGHHALSVRFKKLAASNRIRLADLLDGYASGPASFQTDADEDDFSQAVDRGLEEEEREDLEHEEEEHEELGSQGTLVDESPGAEAEGEALARLDAQIEAGFEALEERRRATRHRYTNRVIALGEEATRVLLGRDLSTNGMRVGANEALSLGSRVQLAIYSPTRGGPVVLDAEVRRDDGQRGMVLAFLDISEDASKAIREMLSQLPALDLSGESGDDSEAESGVFVSEIVAE